VGVKIHSQPGLEPTTLEAVGNEWRYALVVMQTGDDDDYDTRTEVCMNTE